MKNKVFVQVITVLLILASIYQLSFTFKVWSIEGKAEKTAQSKYPDNTTAQDSFLKVYYDSLEPVEVYDLGVGAFTYQECKEEQLNLGLDLQGGMNVTLEVSTPDIIRAMAGKTKDKDFLDAMKAAEADYQGQRNFVDVLAAKYNDIAPEGRIAGIFFSKELESELPNKWESTNEEIYDYLKKESSSAIDRAFEIISTRIDKFGVAQPNIQRLDNGRILVELPGVDDPDRVRSILQSSAKLEFWRVYQNYEAYKFLETVNKVVYGKQQLDDTTSESSAPTLTPADESIEDALTSVDTGSTEEGSLDLASDDNVGSLDVSEDSNAVDSNKSDAQKIAENPVLSRLIPNVDQETNSWTNSAHVGYVAAKDRDLFDRYFNMPEVQAALPNNLVFKWSFKPTNESGQFYMLYALKADKDGEPALAGDVITDARPSRELNGSLSVSMSMNQEGAKAWKRITAAASKVNPKECIAIVLDELVYSAPTVQGEIPNGQSNISGNFDQKEAEDLSNILKAGKLPAPAKIAGESTVGPSLGEKAIKAGLLSLVVGFSLVILFMIFYYGKAGLYADIALLANLVFIIGVLSGLGAALTLPGMAGLVLTIGMAVDANVLVFERVREELRAGKSLKLAVKDGYAGAYSSIIDANITTIIAGVILWVLGKGPVMGFAVILVIGILSSLFTSIFLTRLFIDRDIEKGRETSFYSGMSKNLFTTFNFDFIGKRKLFYTISSVIIIAGIVSLATRGLSTGVDFKGGWSFVVQVDNSSVSELRSELESSLEEGGKPVPTEVKSYGSADQFKITTAYMIDSTGVKVDSTVKADLLKVLAKHDVKESSILSVDRVGPTIAKDIKVRSSWAIAIALIGMFIYIVARFRKWGFGLGATAALFHDVMIVFSIYSIFYGILPFSLDIDQAFIAAILTVVGYSINDTVVVFDRVREFLDSHRHEKDTAGVINNAINQTLSRTLITSLTTLLVIVILFVFGGEGLKDFTFALLVGVAVGTYSSVCVATPIVVDFFKREKK
jgi:SecD/SecF fusion protein